ncbi:MAG TPA: hypothetical protein VFG10_03360 [Saprospiraceae bacterium]|nr:hypothetical protein [Saprospiraceae bacterium]
MITRLHFNILIFSLLSLVDLYSQPGNKLYAVRSFNTEGFVYYDQNGKVVLSTPPGHAPCIEEFTPFNPGNYYVIPFEDKVMTVLKPDGFYLINHQQKVLRTFDKTYQFVTSVKGGYFMATKIISSEGNSGFIEYYNSKGEQCFGNLLYKYGSKVIDDKALVRVWSPGAAVNAQSEDWLLIDDKGNVIKNITAESGKEI